MENRNKDYMEPFLLFAAFFLAGYLMQSRQAADPALFSDPYFLSAYLITVLPQLALLIYIIGLKPGRRLRDYGIVAPTLGDIGRGVLAFCGIWAVLIPVMILFSLLIPAGTAENWGGIAWEMNNPRLLPLLFLVFMLTGYMEELFFRVYLLNHFDRLGVPRRMAIPLALTLFSIGHFYQGWLGVLVTAVIGGILTFVYLRYRSLHTAAIAHGLYNFSVLLFSTLLPSGGG